MVANRPIKAAIWTSAIAARAAGGWAWAEAFAVRGRGPVGAHGARPRPPRFTSTPGSQHHAWRGQSLAGALAGPPGPGLRRPGRVPGRDDVVRPFSEASGLLVKALAGLEGDVERAAAHGRVVLGRSLYEYGRLAERLSPVSAGPLARALPGPWPMPRLTGRRPLHYWSTCSNKRPAMAPTGPPLPAPKSSAWWSARGWCSVAEPVTAPFPGAPAEVVAA